jgi:hypothetical protein
MGHVITGGESLYTSFSANATFRRLALFAESWSIVDLFCCPPQQSICFYR